jgi:hypothetical protein
VVRSRPAGIVVGTALALVLAACGQGGTHADPQDPNRDPRDPNPNRSAEKSGHKLPRLTPQQLERYYLAQIAWRDCVVGEGLVFPQPPSLQEFVAEGGTWWVGSDISEDDWNRLFAGPSQVSNRCGEPPYTADFQVGRRALERLYAWQVKVVACLEAERFPLDGSAPPVEEFIRTGGSNWVPAREFHSRYGYPGGAVGVRIATRCGNDDQDLWLQATDFDVHRA